MFYIKIFVNGNWLGVHEDPLKLVTILKLLRQNGIINVFTSINFDIVQLELSILTDGGRCCRPLFIMENNKLLITNQIADSLKENKIVWSNLIGGLKNK